MNEYQYTYAWKNNERRADLFGKPCKIVSKGSSMRSVLVEFEDGTRLITSQRALRRRSDATEPPKRGDVSVEGTPPKPRGDNV